MDNAKEYDGTTSHAQNVHAARERQEDAADLVRDRPLTVGQLPLVVRALHVVHVDTLFEFEREKSFHHVLLRCPPVVSKNPESRAR